MKRPSIAQILNFQVLAITAIFLQSCGVVKSANTGQNCSAKQAVIQVYDSSIRRVCGCTEGAGSLAGGQCTISVGTSIYIYYPGITIPHQIYVGGFTGPQPSYRNPSSANPSSFVDVVLLNSTGSYSFTDNMSGLTGTVVVQ